VVRPQEIIKVFVGSCAYTGFLQVVVQDTLVARSIPKVDKRRRRWKIHPSSANLARWKLL
jgi:hypothetical protein